MAFSKMSGNTGTITSKLRELLNGKLPGSVSGAINQSYNTANQGLQSSLAENELIGTAGGYNAAANLDTGRFGATQNAATNLQQFALPALANVNQGQQQYDLQIQQSNYQQLQDQIKNALAERQLKLQEDKANDWGAQLGQILGGLGGAALGSPWLGSALGLD